MPSRPRLWLKWCVILISFQAHQYFEKYFLAFLFSFHKPKLGQFLTTSSTYSGGSLTPCWSSCKVDCPTCWGWGGPVEPVWVCMETAGFNRESLGLVSETRLLSSSWLRGCGQAICFFDSTDRNPTQKSLTEIITPWLIQLESLGVWLSLCLFYFLPLPSPIPLLTHIIAFFFAFICRGTPFKESEGWSSVTSILSWQTPLPLLRSHTDPGVRKAWKVISSPPGEHREGKLQFTKASGAQKTKQPMIIHYGAIISSATKMGLRHIL